MKSKWRRLLKIKDNRGATVIMVALSLVIIVGVATFAVDIGYLMIVRNQLQNAADAAALAGASSLIPPGSSELDWAQAETQAASAIGLNKSDGVTLTDCVVQTGYWNIAHNPDGLQGTGITPGPKDFPAVQVTVSKNAGQNSGPVKPWFAPVIGIKTINASAVATAVIASPGTVLPGNVPAKGGTLPVAISKAVADQIDSYNDPTKLFRIGSSYHYPVSAAGQWTSFDVDSNNVPTIRDLIANGNPVPLSIGDNIWIQPGTKTTLYTSVLALVGMNVLMPVVQTADGTMETHEWAPIIGFVGFHITDSVGGSDKYIEGYFLPGFIAKNTGGIGENKGYGVFKPPSLVR